MDIIQEIVSTFLGKVLDDHGNSTYPISSEQIAKTIEDVFIAKKYKLILFYNPYCPHSMRLYKEIIDNNYSPYFLFVCPNKNLKLECVPIIYISSIGLLLKGKHALEYVDHIRKKLQ